MVIWRGKIQGCAIWCVAENCVLHNTTNGITLIALVITIIVMLILVAVTIQVATEGNLFKHAGNAIKETKNAILQENYVGEGKIQVGGESYNSIEDYVATKIGDDGGETGGSLSTTTVLTQGQEVYFTGVPTEKFYVLFDSDNSTPTVKIISKFDVNTTVSPYTQATDNTIYPVRFDDNSNIYVGSEIEALVNTYVGGKLEITSLETGESKGLLLQDDLETLNGTGTLSDGTSLTGIPSWAKNTNFWLGFTHSTNSVWCVYNGNLSYGGYDYSSGCGLRPVLVVNKTRLSIST